MLYAVSAVLIIVSGIILAKTVRFSETFDPPESADLTELPEDECVKRLSGAIQIKTVWDPENMENSAGAFNAFRQFLDDRFPLIAANLEKFIINKHAVVYRWKGKGNNDPIAFLAHYDVVPVEEGTKKLWTHEAFSGAVSDGFVWGRGTLDMKGTLMAVMESVEKLIHEGFTPHHTIYICLGHDEENGGPEGASKIVEYFKEQGVRLAFTLDEGMAVLDPAVSPSRVPQAVIGVAEKGYLTLNLTAKSAVGHSSTPPGQTAIGNLANAWTNIEKLKFPAVLTEPVQHFYKSVAKSLPLWKRVMHGNAWLFRPVILSLLGRSDSTRAMVQTTYAPTIVQGGIKENILPSKARMVVNFRLIPGDSVEKAFEKVQAVAQKHQVSVEKSATVASDPSSVSSIDTSGFAAIKKTIGQLFPSTLVCSGLVYAMTDSRHYAAVSQDCYRFAPFVLRKDDMQRIHGIDERIPVEDYIRMIQFYRQLLINLAEK